jgi:hypothetical protein
MNDLKAVAKEALGAFEAISDAAGRRLQDKGMSLDSLAMINQATAEAIARDMQIRNAQRVSDCLRLRREPALARLVVVDEDENPKTIYISPVSAIDVGGITSCSYLSPMGRLATLPVGGGEDILLPGGRRWFDIAEKMTFKSGEFSGQWDSRPAIEFREGKGPRTIKSLRELLREEGLSEEQADLVAQWLAEEGKVDGDNVVDGIMREVITAMGLRVAALLNQFQDEILRLPLDSRIAVLGPPGTGKTTTLIKRLRRTVDMNHLDPESEQGLIMEPDAGGLDHPNSWVMFTPTELLRQYVKEAFGKEGVPVHDQRLKTWDDYRLEIGKRDLNLLRTGTRRGFILKDNLPVFLPDTLQRQIEWFEAFDAFQQDAFLAQLKVEAERLAESGEGRLPIMGRRVLSAVERGAGKPLQVIGELAALAEDLRNAAAALNPRIQTALDAPLQSYAQADKSLLEQLSAFVAKLLIESVQETSDEVDDEADEDDDEVETEGSRPLSGRRLTADVFRKAMRARAISLATGRALGARSRNARVLEFLASRGLALPELKATGVSLLLQRASRRIARASTTWLSSVPLRYRQFRRAMRTDEKWYSQANLATTDVHPAEIDAVMLAVLGQARAMASDGFLRARLGENPPALLDAAARLRRNQVLIDEATDFSPVQLAIMRNLADTRTDAVFVSGDFNQRLTVYGSRTEDDLLWAFPDIDIHRISITYRQSRKLAQFAVNLARIQGAEVSEQAPEGLDNQGFDPVFGPGLASTRQLAEWLAMRIAEIERLADGALPTIAVLAEREAALEALAAALNDCLSDMNVRAVACPKGLVKGQDGDVRIFDVQHIKGLEFEAVFFVNVDNLAKDKPELFDRYIYVGATRAATFLGLATVGAELPSGIDELRSTMLSDWS